MTSQMTSQMASQMTVVTSSLTALSESAALTETKAEANRVGVGALETQASSDLTAEVSIASSGYCGPHRVQLTIGGTSVSYMGGRDTNSHPGGSPTLAARGRWVT